MVPNPGELSLEGEREVLCFLGSKMTMIMKYFIDLATVFQEARNTPKLMRSIDCQTHPDFSEIKMGPLACLVIKKVESVND